MTETGNGMYAPPPVVVVPSGGQAGNIGTNDAAVLALLADTARAGRGGYGGYGGGSGGEGGHGGYGGMYTNASALQHTLECARDQVSQQGFMSAISGICTSVAQSEGRMTDRLRDAQLDSARESADLARQIAACCCDSQKGFLEQALRFQECCCETQKLVLSENQKTREMINENALRIAIDTNNVNATVAGINGPAAQNAAAIIAAIQANGGHNGGGH